MGLCLYMLSVNQLNAQIKITEVWKATHDLNHSFKIQKISHENDICVTRAVTNGDLKEFGKSDMVKFTFLSNASKAWNNCPMEVKKCVTLWSAKKAIPKFVETLPI